MGVASEQGLLSLGLQFDTMLEAQAETLTPSTLIPLESFACELLYCCHTACMWPWVT